MKGIDSQSDELLSEIPHQVERTRFYASDLEIPSSIAGEHLEEAKRDRIKIRQYDSNIPDLYLRFAVGADNGELLADATVVNYYESAENLRSMGMKGGNLYYVISQIDETPKRSHSFRNCTGLVVMGEDTVTGDQISFVTHQNPSFTNSFVKEQFDADLESTFAEFLKRAKPGTVDIGLIGGNFYEPDPGEDEDESCQVEYARAIPQLRQTIREIFYRMKLPLVPVVVLSGADYSHTPAKFRQADMLLDTQARIVLFSRPEQLHDLSNEVYDAGDIERYAEQLKNTITTNPKRGPVGYAAKLRALTRTFAEVHTSTPNFISYAEAKTHEDIKALGLPTVNSIKRTNRDNPESADVYLKIRPKVLIDDNVAEELRDAKLSQIPNFESFVDAALSDMGKLADNHIQILSGFGTFFFCYDKANSEIGYLIGGDEGFMFIEENTDIDSDDAFVQNIASFQKAFCDLLDEMVTADIRSKYMHIMCNKIRDVLKERLSQDRYSSIVERF